MAQRDPSRNGTIPACADPGKSAGLGCGLSPISVCKSLAGLIFCRARAFAAAAGAALLAGERWWPIGLMAVRQRKLRAGSPPPKSYPFFKPCSSYSLLGCEPEKPVRTVVLLQHSLQKGTEARAAIGATHDNARMRLASQAARAVVLDWHIAEERIHWDGSIDILPFPLGGGHPQAFLDAVTRAGRDALTALLESNAPYSSQFELNLEMASALGAVGFTFAGTRVPGSDGRTERIIGMLRESTEKQREMQRLTYLATRDELTGHLNRNALRTELQLAIDARQGRKPPLRLPGGLDRPAGDDQ